MTKLIKELLSLKEGSDDGITTWDNKGVEKVVKFRDKKAFLHLCLTELKHGALGDVDNWMRMAIDAGYNYPEFKTLQKSIDSDFKREL